MAQRCCANTLLFCEKLAHILERLEFEGVTARVEQEHGGLLADLPFETNVRFNHKLRAERLQALGQRFPLFPSQNDAEVRNGYVVAVYRVAMDAFLGCSFRVFVNNQLVALKIEIDPLVAGTTFFQAKHFAIKCACASKVVDRDCEVERREAHQNSNTVFVGGGRSK
jgi:hypothetical protein